MLNNYTIYNQPENQKLFLQETGRNYQDFPELYVQWVMLFYLSNLITNIDRLNENIEKIISKTDV